MTLILDRCGSLTWRDLVWRWMFRLGFPVAQIWWRTLRQHHQGALLALHVGQSVLLLRSSYRESWNFPGGSVRRGETPEAAVQREVSKEIGLVLTTPLRRAGEVRGMWEGRRDTVFLFALQLDTAPRLRLDQREIIGARLVPLADIHMLQVTAPVRAYIGSWQSSLANGHEPNGQC